jgi:basic membrane protein A
MTRRALALGGGVVAAAAIAGQRRAARAADGPVRVAMVTDTAGLGDGNFNDSANRGGLAAQDRFDIDFVVRQPTSADDYVPLLLRSAASSDLVVAVGYLLAEAVLEVARAYPAVRFLTIDAEADAPNVASALFKEEEAGFLAGVAAAATSASGVVGCVAGRAIPPVVRYASGFVAGARCVRADVTTPVAYLDSFDDPDGASAAAAAQIAAGADVLFAPAAGGTAAVFATAAAAGAWVIAADLDQESTLPGVQLCVAEKRIADVVALEIGAVVDGAFAGGVQRFGLAAGGVGLGDPGGRLAAEVAALAARYAAAITAGAIVPPTTGGELAAFVPVAPAALPEA